MCVCKDPYNTVYDNNVDRRIERGGNDRFLVIDVATRLHVTEAGRYANVDSHLAAHQKLLILIRLSDYSRFQLMEMFRAWKVIRSVW